ncbi:hypothetical protein BIU97_04145 [Curtobacterium sp. MCBA15_009]|nr:hypothetical protein BIU97_04145 [Curtobacterium sp. MCBA15_009]
MQLCERVVDPRSDRFPRLSRRRGAVAVLDAVQLVEPLLLPVRAFIAGGTGQHVDRRHDDEQHHRQQSEPRHDGGSPRHLDGPTSTERADPRHEGRHRRSEPEYQRHDLRYRRSSTVVRAPPCGTDLRHELEHERHQHPDRRHHDAEDQTVPPEPRAVVVVRADGPGRLPRPCSIVHAFLPRRRR